MLKFYQKHPFLIPAGGGERERERERERGTGERNKERGVWLETVWEGKRERTNKKQIYKRLGTVNAYRFYIVLIH